jgi:hypothetical protein
VKDELTSEFEKATKVADALNIENLNKELKIQRYGMNTEFEKKDTKPTRYPC